MKIAIVGASEYRWSEKQKEKVLRKIETILYAHGYPQEPSLTMVSGHCPKGGVDIWAEEIADEFGIKKEIYTPEVNQWNSALRCCACGQIHTLDTWICLGEGSSMFDYVKGYRERNIEIAKACDVLYCIEPKGNPSRGGRYTMKYARELGKEVHLLVIE